MIETQLREIKRRLRLAMNGVVSTAMRQRGMDYSLNFGLTLPPLKRIARDFTPHADLAQRLWSENIRECKLLATLLYPTASFSRDIAETWIHSTPNNEIADYLVTNLLASTPYATELAYQSIAGHGTIRPYIGIQLLMRRPMTPPTPHQLAPIITALSSPTGTISAAALNLLTRMLALSQPLAHHIISTVAHSGNTPAQRYLEEEYTFLYTEFQNNL